MSEWARVAILAGLAGLLAGFLLARRLGRRAAAPSRAVPSPAETSLGYSFLLHHELDRAIDAFARVARADPAALDVQLVLGNLQREKGQVERAIHIHRGLLERPDLDAPDRALVRLCLARDFGKAGLVDRAATMLHEVLESDPDDREALGQLEKLYEGMRDWARAYDVAVKLHGMDGGHDARVLAFLRNQMGEAAVEEGDARGAQVAFEEALAHDPGCIPAAVNLGGLFLSQRKFKRARAMFEEVVERDPRRLTAVWRRLLEALRALGEEGRLEELCRRRIAADPDDWRPRLVLGELAEQARDWGRASACYLDAMRRNPHAFSLHHRLLSVLARTRAEPERLSEYLDVCDEAMTLADRYLCVRCHYRAGELLWRCPSCQAWDPFVEERG